MCRSLLLSALFLVYILSLILGISATKSTSEHGVTNGKSEQARKIRTKPMPTPDLHETKTKDFPDVSYPLSILDMSKTYTYDPVAIDPYAPKTEFDRSVKPEQLTANLRKKLKTVDNSASTVTDTIRKITTVKDPLPTHKNKQSTAPNTAFSGKFAPKMGTDDKPNYYNSRQWARKLATLSKGSRISESNSKALSYARGPTKTKDSTSVCASLWSKDIPVIQVIENAITTIEKMISNSMLFNSSQHPSISLKEATKIISVIQNIQEILKILDCMNGIDTALYYNVKTGVSNKTSEPKKPIPVPLELANPKTKVVNDEVKNESNTTVTVIQIVDHAITIVEDLLNSTVLQNIEMNSTNHNVVVLSVDEADEMVNVVETIKDILGILEELNGNVNSSVNNLRKTKTSDGAVKNAVINPQKMNSSSILKEAINTTEYTQSIQQKN